MSKPVKNLIQKELSKRLDGATNLAVIGFTGLDSNTTNTVRGKLAKKQMRVSVVKNSLAKQTFKALGIESASILLEGPCALVYGGESVVNIARELIEIGKDAGAMQLKGAVMEGTVFRGAEEVAALSKYPTRDEAIANLVAAVLSPGRKLAAAILAPGSKLASVLKTIEEKHGDGGASESAAEAPAADAAAATA
ncbi:MAG: 50S ribosomal protein L10 [Phycisphaerae bacterium]|nr:50S ribosomal protein L10 [Phycisphaerae bacterium]